MLLYEGEFREQAKARQRVLKKKRKEAQLKLRQEIKEGSNKVKAFKKSKEVKKAQNEFKRVVNVLYRKRTNDIVDDSINVFELLRLAIFVGIPFTIHPALGLITWLTDRIISEKVNEKYRLTVINRYKNEIKYIDNELKQDDITDEEKKNLEKVKRRLEQDKLTLESYFDDITKYKVKRAEIEKEDDDSDDDFGDWSW